MATEHPATRMRDSGRSWTYISDQLGVSVAEAKAAVQEDKLGRRRALARTPEAEDRNGLRDLCADCDQKCAGGAMRKNHLDKLGVCLHCSCNEFVHLDRRVLPWWTLGPETDPQYVNPETKLTGNLRYDALYLGIQKINRRWAPGGRGRNPAPDMPEPSLKAAVRRGRKKLMAGKPVKKHRDRPRRGNW